MQRALPYTGLGLALALILAAAHAAAQPPAPDVDAGDGAWVRAELAWIADPLVCPYYPAATVQGTALEVSGYVPDATVRDRALQLARQFGGLPVVDNLKVLPAVTVAPLAVPTEVLLGGALKALQSEFPECRDQVRVTCLPDRRLIVAGTVRTEEQRLLMSRCLRHIPGCVAVVNFLEVASRKPEMPPPPVQPALSAAAAEQAQPGHQVTAPRFATDRAPGLSVQAIPTDCAAQGVNPGGVVPVAYHPADQTPVAPGPVPPPPANPSSAEEVVVVFDGNAAPTAPAQPDRNSPRAFPKTVPATMPPAQATPAPSGKGNEVKGPAQPAEPAAQNNLVAIALAQLIGTVLGSAGALITALLAGAWFHRRTRVAAAPVQVQYIRVREDAGPAVEASRMDALPAGPVVPPSPVVESTAEPAPGHGDHKPEAQPAQEAEQETDAEPADPQAEAMLRQIFEQNLELRQQLHDKAAD